MAYELIQGDCIEKLTTIADNSVDLVVTSPPYDNLRKYESKIDIPKIAHLLYSKLKLGGVVVWVVGDQTVKGSETGTSFRTALDFMSAGFKLYDTMIFAKKNPMPQPKSKRYCSGFEYMFVFSKGLPKTFNPIIEPCSYFGKRRSNSSNQRKDGLNSSITWGAGQEYKPTKIKSNIWYYGVGNERMPEHPAVFPLRLARDHILSWSAIGDTVLDPFCGSGTTAIAALENDRNFIGIELNAEYISLSSKRIDKYLDSRI